MKNKLYIICILILFISVQLFSEIDQPVGIWDIDDFKNAIMPRNGRFIIYEFIELELTADKNENKYFLCKWNTNSSDNNRYVSLYAFNKNYEFQIYLIAPTFISGLNDEAKEIVMRGIPGYHLWNSVISIGDFNNDGMNEIASLIFAGSEPTFRIVGIDTYSNEIIHYFNNDFSVDFPPTYTPIEFVYYKGIHGFKMIEFIDPSRASISHPIPGLRNLAWIFYAWNEVQRKFVEIEEVDPMYLGETGAQLFQAFENTVDEVPEIVIIEEETEQYQELVIPDANNKSMVFILIGIITCIIMVFLIVYVLFKRKKRFG